MRWGVLPAEHSCVLVIGGGHPEPELPVIGCTGLIARPRHWERALPCIGDVDM